jgi:sorbitol-specific phosphotransferase system component IIBC
VGLVSFAKWKAITNLKPISENYAASKMQYTTGTVDISVYPKREKSALTVTAVSFALKLHLFVQTDAVVVRGERFESGGDIGNR